MSDFDSRDQKPQQEEPFNFADLFEGAEFVFIYTRAQAIADGTLVDVSEMAKEVGFVFPVAVTSALWADIEDIPDDHAYQTPEARLRDVLTIGAFAIRTSKGDGSTLVYPLTMHTSEGEAYRVKLVCGPGDHAEPVITLMKPDES